jgi:ribosomal protein L11 methyltransferase
LSTYTEVTFQQISSLQQEILVAELAQAGFSGFEEKSDSLSAFIETGKLDHSLLNAIAKKLALSFEERIIPDQNWNKEWESHFEPVIIDELACIRADFHPAAPNVKYDIVITPKMSFGTGHHATTWLMIKAMGELDIKNKSVLDFGTGTGILAICAVKMGAKEVTAIDNDQWSIENARENFEKNDCGGIELIKADKIDEGKKYDLILANINRNVILDNLGSMKNCLPPGGQILLSGLLRTDEDVIVEHCQRLSFVILRKTGKGEWVSFLLIFVAPSPGSLVL